MSKCAWAECGKEAQVKGFCRSHYKYNWALEHPGGRHPKKCSIPGCSFFVHAKGLCKKHWLRFYRRGDVKRKIVSDGLAKAHPSEHATYRSMVQRCSNKKCPEYKWYGGRGIKVCERWLGPYGFHHFYEDMGDRPEGEYFKHCKYTIDRINVDGDYCPENCRWADWHTQASNRTANSDIVGVNKFGDKWRARLVVNGKEYGSVYQTKQEAAQARAALEDKYLTKEQNMF